MPPHVAFRIATAILLAAASTAAPREASAEAPPGRPMRVTECVDLALHNNIDVQTASEDITASEARRSGVRGRFGPSVRVDAYLHEWNSPYEIPFTLDPTRPPAVFPVRDQLEWNATVSVSQPITGLIAIFEAYKVQSIGVDIAHVRKEIARRETAFRVVESYYRLAQATKLAVVAQSSVEQLQTQRSQAKSFHDNGVVSRDDVLRAELAVANAEQRLIQARSRISYEQTRLAMLVRLPPEVNVDVQPFTDDPTANEEPLTLEQVDKSAQLQRIELTEIDKRMTLDGAEVKMARLKLLPQVSAEGAFIHNEGSQFVQTNAAFVGARATWNVWDWGTTTSGIAEAKARARQGELARAKLSGQIRLEVRRAFLELTAASEAMTVAQASVAQATENFRLVKKRYDANAATSFDVIDAEGLLTQARGQLETALYDRVIARAALRRAMGVAPEKLARE